MGTGVYADLLNSGVRCDVDRSGSTGALRNGGAGGLVLVTPAIRMVTTDAEPV